MPIARAGDIDLHYEERGSGLPPLLLVAGIPAVTSDWERLAKPLSTTRRVIAFDNRGTGLSTVTPGPYTTGQLAADAVALLDVLEITRADVFGMSLGGMIAQELAIGWPERVRRLVLGCTHAGMRHAAPAPRETGRAFTMDTDDWSERVRALAPLAFAPDVDGELLERFIAEKLQDAQDPAGYAAQLEAVRTHDAYDRLPRIEAPTLVVTGSDDQVIPAPSSDLLQLRIPRAKLAVIEGAGHLFFLERPRESLETVQAFLDGPA